MEIVAIVGLPGSGKTRLIQEFEARDYQCFDDMNRNWEGSTARMLQLINEQRDIACSDIMFCTRFYRRRLKRTLGVPIHWIFFENSPWQCAKNCLYRQIFEERDRPLLEEIRMIRRLSRLYAPPGNVRPVVIAETQGGRLLPKSEDQGPGACQATVTPEGGRPELAGIGRNWPETRSWKRVRRSFQMFDMSDVLFSGHRTPGIANGH
jgi:hypothetical protein